MDVWLCEWRPERRQKTGSHSFWIIFGHRLEERRIWTLRKLSIDILSDFIMRYEMGFWERRTVRQVVKALAMPIHWDAERIWQTLTIINHYFEQFNTTFAQRIQSRNISIVHCSKYLVTETNVSLRFFRKWCNEVMQRTQLLHFVCNRPLFIIQVIHF